MQTNDGLSKKEQIVNKITFGCGIFFFALLILPQLDVVTSHLPHLAILVISSIFAWSLDFVMADHPVKLAAFLIIIFIGGKAVNIDIAMFFAATFGFIMGYYIRDTRRQ